MKDPGDTVSGSMIYSEIRVDRGVRRLCPLGQRRQRVESLQPVTLLPVVGTGLGTTLVTTPVPGHTPPPVRVGPTTTPDHGLVPPVTSDPFPTSVETLTEYILSSPGPSKLRGLSHPRH